MFNLVVTVVAIGLFVLIGIASLMYLGGAFTEGGDRALYATYLSQAQQLDGAALMYFNERAARVPFDPADPSVALNALLDNNYLKDIPDGEWVVAPNNIYRPIESVDQCLTLNKLAGAVDSDATVDDEDICPPCNDTAFQNFPGCMMPG